MALKVKLTKVEFEALPDVLKAEYVADGDDFKLDVEGGEDTGALKRAKVRETELRKTAESERKALQEKLDGLDTLDAKKRGDIETLEKSWGEKHTALETSSNTLINALKAETTKSLLVGMADKIAGEISTTPKLMSREIQSRLTVEFDGATPSLKVLDADGKPSALTVAELSTEFCNNDDFAQIIIAGKGSGGGDGGGDKNNNAYIAPKQADGSPVILAKMTPKEMAAEIAASKAKT